MKTMTTTYYDDILATLERAEKLRRLDAQSSKTHWSIKKVCESEAHNLRKAMKLIEEHREMKNRALGKYNMSAKVINQNWPTRLDLPPERILEESRQRKLSNVVILGYEQNGDEYFASSIADGADVLWLLERLRKKLLEVPDDD